MEQTKRKEEILRLLAERGYLSVPECGRLLYLSEATVRREFREMEDAGMLLRNHGGALPAADNLHRPYNFRSTTMYPEKKRIAKKAAALVPDGALIFLDTSTTALCVVEELQSKKGLTVVTNSLPALNLLQSLHIPAKCTGGDLRSESMGLVGHHAERFVASLHADWFFFSTSSISEDGVISDYSEQESYLRSEMLAHAAHSAYLFDHTKFGKRAAFCVTDASRVEHLISDAPLLGATVCDE